MSIPLNRVEVVTTLKTKDEDYVSKAADTQVFQA
jgi:hypothetical protein